MLKKNNIIITILALHVIGNLFAQTDRYGNPIFNSVITLEESFDSFNLTSCYYTLKNNIENEKSSVFISQNPTLNEVEKAATNLMSEFFIITKGQKTLAMVSLLNEQKRQFMTIIIATNEQSILPCKLEGDITENRAQEIVKNQYDPAAKIENGYLYFNYKTFKIINNEDIHNAVLKLIKKKKLDAIETSSLQMLSQTELSALILSETKEGGELDFFTEIIGKESEGAMIINNRLYTNDCIALYKWGRVCYELGINTVEDALHIFSEFKGRELTKIELTFIQLGFNREN